MPTCFDDIFSNEVNDSRRRNCKNELWTLYTFEHEDITSGKIEFLSRNGNKFHVRWTGTAHVGLGDEPVEGVPFIFDGDVTYEEITTCCRGINNINNLKTELSKFINVEEYELVSESNLGDYKCEFKLINGPNIKNEKKKRLKKLNLYRLLLE